jgi:RNA recognition motif-containing protein
MNKKYSLNEMIKQFERISENCYENNDHQYSPFERPRNYSYVHMWCSDDREAIEDTVSIEYTTTEEFQQNLLRLVTSIFNTTALEMVRSGGITNFGFQIGLELPSGKTLNDLSVVDDTE